MPVHSAPPRTLGLSCSRLWSAGYPARVAGVVLRHHPDAITVLGRVLRPDARSQDIETCSKEQRLGRGLLLEPCDDALQPVPGDGSLFGLPAEEVEGGDRTQIGACRRGGNGLRRWVAEARWLGNGHLRRAAQDGLDVLPVHVTDDDENVAPGCARALSRRRRVTDTEGARTA